MSNIYISGKVQLQRRREHFIQKHNLFLPLKSFFFTDTFRIADCCTRSHRRRYHHSITIDRLHLFSHILVHVLLLESVDEHVALLQPAEHLQVVFGIGTQAGRRIWARHCKLETDTERTKQNETAATEC